MSIPKKIYSQTLVELPPVEEKVYLGGKLLPVEYKTSQIRYKAKDEHKQWVDLIYSIKSNAYRFFNVSKGVRELARLV